MVHLVSLELKPSERLETPEARKDSSGSSKGGAFHIRLPIAWQSGQLVEVRNLEEIRATLDEEGKLEGIPFMPEMARYCGQQFMIFRRADKTCVEGHGIGRLSGTVFLEGLRCDGAMHDGCQRGCLFYWKTAWLKRVEAKAPVQTAPVQEAPIQPVESAVDAVAPEPSTTRDGRYYCQSTELAAAVSPLSRWNPWGYFHDLFVRETTPTKLVRLLWGIVAGQVLKRLGRSNEPAGRQRSSPVATLGLKPGEWVEVKSREEIEATLTPDGRNRGLTFEMEMVQHCGRRYRVQDRVRKIISERTGEMITLANTVTLQGVFCTGSCARNCPRSNPLFWREIWLRRVASEDSGT